MALDLGTMFATLEVRDKEFHDGLDRSEQHLGVFGGVLKKGALAIGVAAGATLGTALFKGFERLDAIDQAKAKLAGLGNTTGTVTKIMDNALASVKGTAFGLGDAATVAASAVAAGVKPGKDLEHTLKLVADAATIGGTSLGEMGAVFNKVAASNKIQGDTINQLNDMGIPIVQLLGKTMHKSASEVTDLASKGKIDFATFQKAMESGLGGSALKSGNTFSGALANVYAALGRTGAALLTGLFPIAKEVFGGVTTLLDDVTAAVGPVALAFANRLPGAFSTVENAFSRVDFASWGDKLTPLLDAVQDFASALVDAGITAGPALLDIGKGLEPLAKLSAAAGVTALTLAFEGLGPVVDGTATSLANVVDLVKSNQTTFSILAGIIMIVLVPAFVAWGVQATIAAGKNVIAWLSAKIGAAQSAGMQVLSLTLITLNWIKAGVQATLSAARIVAAWLLSKLEVAGTILLYGVAFAMMAAGWIASAAAATAGAIAMAAAWLVAIWPIALVVAAIAGVVFLVIKYWDQIKGATAAAWHWVTEKISAAVSFVVGFVKEHWPLILAILTGPIGLAVLYIVKHFDKIKDAGSDVIGWVRGIPGKLKDLASKFGDAGQHLIRAFIDGLSKAGGIAAHFASSIWGAIKDAINSGIDKLNGLLDFKIPVKGLPDIHVNAPNIGHLAMGTDDWRGGPTWLGDGGEPELVDLPAHSRVTPMSKLLREMGKQKQDMHPPIEIHVHPSAGMDESQLADMVFNRLEFARTS